MYPESHNEDGYTLLPKAVEGALRRGVSRLVGLSLLFVVAVSWLSLVTWSITDPSLTHSTRDAATNLLGYPGAVISDLMLQTLGVASAVLLLAPMFWALQLTFAGTLLGLRWKVLSFAASIMCLAGGLSLIPKLIAWPLNHGYGGIFGDGIAALAAWGLAHVVAEYANALGFLVLAGCGVFFVLTSLGVPVSRMRSAVIDAITGAKRSARRGSRRRAPEKALAPESDPQAPAEPQLARTSAFQSEAVNAHSPRSKLRQGLLPERHWREPVQEEANEFGRGDFERQRPARPTQQGMAVLPGPGGGATNNCARVGFMPEFELLDNDPEVRGDDFDFDTDADSAHIAKRFAPESRMGTRNDLREVLRDATRALIRPEGRPAEKPMVATPAEKLETTAEDASREGVHRIAAPRDYGRSVVGENLAASNDDAVKSDVSAPDQPPQLDVMDQGHQEVETVPVPPRTMVRRQGGYIRPSLNLLQSSSAARPGPEMTEAVLRGTTRLLEDVLERFAVIGHVTEVRPGPVVTAYQVELEKGTNPLRVVGLADDIGRGLNAGSMRVAVGSGTGNSSVIIEMPNVHRHRATLRDLLSGESYRSFGGSLPVALGHTTEGHPIVADLGGLNNLLVAGCVSSGKSTLLRSILMSLVFRKSADDCRFLLFDPKLLEFGSFNGVPHLLCPVICETEKMVAALDWLVAEIDERAQRMAKLSVRSVELFNNRVRNAKKRGEMIARTVRTGFCERTGKPIYEHEQMEYEPMPHIVVAIDELSDLMSAAPRECEASLLRIAEKGRAVGVHIVAATKTTTGLCLTDQVRAALGSSMSFKLGSKVGSRTVLGEQGAEQLLEQGDAILVAASSRSMRIHTPFMPDEDFEAVAAVLRDGGPSRYASSLMERLQEAVEPYPEAMAAMPGKKFAQ